MSSSKSWSKEKGRQTTLLEFVPKHARTRKGSQPTTHTQMHYESYRTNTIHIHYIDYRALYKLLKNTGLHAYRLINGLDPEQLSRKCTSFFPLGDTVVTPCEVNISIAEELYEEDLARIFDVSHRRVKKIKHLLRYTILYVIAARKDYTINTSKGLLERKLSLSEGNGVLRVKPFISPVLNENLDRDAARITLAYRVSSVTRRDMLDQLLEKAKKTVDELIDYVVDYLRKHGLKAARLELAVTSREYTHPTPSASAKLNAARYSIPRVTLLFYNAIPYDKPFGLYLYGPYNLPIGEIRAYIVAHEHLIQGVLARLRQTLSKHVAYLSRSQGINLELRLEDIPLNYDNPHEFIKAVRRLRIGELGEGKAAIVVLEEREQRLYERTKALSLKKGFYFKAQIMLKETIDKMSLGGGGRYIVATLLSSLLFRAEGTPWIPAIKANLFGHHDVLSSRLAVGIGFSKPLEKGFTRASVALLDLYSARIHVETLDLGLRKREALEVTEDDSRRLANLLKEHVDRGDYREIAIYVSKLLSPEEATRIYNSLSEKLRAEKIVIASVTDTPPLMVLGQRRLDNSALQIPTAYGDLLLLWPSSQTAHPLTVVIHRPADLTPRDIIHEIGIANTLRYMYYPASVSAPQRKLAPIEYAAKIARIAHLL